MSAAPEYEELHELVDQLEPHHARHLRALAADLVRAQRTGPPARRGEQSDASAESLTEHGETPVRRRLAFTAIGASGRTDLSERVDDYLAEGFGRT